VTLTPPLAEAAGLVVSSVIVAISDPKCAQLLLRAES
jgi:hypothetical protein